MSGAVLTPTTLVAHESRFPLADGNELFIRDWLIEAETAPCIVIMHGLGEHCGRYLPVAALLHRNGFSVRTYDHRGHGQSSGSRGDIPEALTLVHDAELLIGDFARRCKTRPLLLGHSMGGLFAARIATEGKIPLSGLILSSPALALRLSGLDKLLLKVMGAIAPHFAIANGLKTTWLSHDPEVVRAYENDPLVHNKITASLLNGMLAAIEYAQNHAPVLIIPTLLLVAENDKLIDPQGSRDFHASLPVNISSAHFYADLYHEIFNEADATQVFADLQNWLAARQFSC